MDDKMQVPILTVQSLCFSRRGIGEVLHGISFSAERGDLLAVVGKNGAGKSTLFHCILRLLDGYDGLVSVAGKDVQTMTRREIARSLAFVPQSCKAAFNYSVFDTILMGTSASVSAFGSPQRQQREAVEKAAETLGITSLLPRSFARISGGEQQLALIARAFAQNAPCILMDEPASALDFANQDRVMRAVESVVADGRTVLISLHNPTTVLNCCPKFLALKDGNVAASGDTKTFFDEKLIFDIYGVQSAIFDGGFGKAVIPKRILQAGSRFVRND